MNLALDFRNLEIWGTVITFQIPRGSTSAARFEEAVATATAYFEEIDARFSTYRVDSEVSRIRRGELDIKDAAATVKLVWNRCIDLRELTLRAFDPWAVPGGFDPSGYVKGWAARGWRPSSDRILVSPMG